MKNIHVLKTDKPSRLFYNVGGALLFRNYENHNGVNIYITSDEEIKEGDWLLKCKNINDWNFKSGELEEKDYSYFAVKCVSLALINPEDKKIVLTDNEDLIKDGVQAIDDKFLEWFVKNPSCDMVEVAKYHGINTSIAEVNAISGDGSLNWENKSDLRDYKITIPKEETKQDLEKEMFELEQELDIPSHLRWHNSKPKQETLEEFAKQEAIKQYSEDTFGNLIVRKSIEKGAKWQAERMYSEEDMLEFSEWVSDNDWVYLPSKGCWVNEEEEESEEKFTTKELFNKFKNK